MKIQRQVPSSRHRTFPVVPDGGKCEAGIDGNPHAGIWCRSEPCSRTISAGIRHNDSPAGQAPTRTTAREQYSACVRSAGFTLIELILVIILLGALSATATVFILPPFQAAVDIERRANLVDGADSALTRIGREARNALPNSIRVHNAGHVEFITTRTGGQYRRLPAPGGGSQPLVPARSSDTFDVPGGLPDAAQVATRGAGTNCAASNGDCISVYNTAQAGFNAYLGQNIAAVIDATATTVSYDTGAAGPAFATHSPRQRFFVVDNVVSYVCNAGQLLRYSGYGLQAGTPTLANPELVAENVSSCQFAFNPGTASRRGLLTLQIGMARSGEQVSLLTQTQVMNAP